MKKIYAISVAIAIIIISSTIFQFLKITFTNDEYSSSTLFILETIKIVPLILGVLLIKYSWKKINT